MPDDLEHTLRDSLDRHARATGRPTGELDDVYTRVDRRRSRRRSVAIIGSFAVVAAGVIGIAAISRSGGSTADLAAGAGDGSPSTTIAGPWACTGQLGGDGYATYFDDCRQVSWEEAAQVGCATPVAPTSAVPMTTLPNTAATTVPVGTDPIAVVSPPCGSPVDATAEACMVPITAPTTTAPGADADAATETTYVVVECPVPPEITDTTFVGTVPYTSAPFPSTVPPLSTVMAEQIYVVVQGDSLAGIAEMYGISLDTLLHYNNWQNEPNHVIMVGDQVLIPPT